MDVLEMNDLQTITHVRGLSGREMIRSEGCVEIHAI